mmetsp:Transcript_26422/g.76236  ORF Transcript_26422/g.76236 Transcript_26422/m.76236 type:complete len:324 (+) Transcript_26422:829-1800(+)
MRAAQYHGSEGVLARRGVVGAQCRRLLLDRFTAGGPGSIRGQAGDIARTGRVEGLGRAVGLAVPTVAADAIRRAAEFHLLIGPLSDVLQLATEQGRGDRRRCRCAGRGASLFRILHTLDVLGQVFEGVEGDANGIIAILPILGRVAMVLHEEEGVVHAFGAKHQVQAPIDEQILAPSAVTMAVLVELGFAEASTFVPKRDGISAEHLDRPVEPIPAVVQVHTPGRLLDVAQDDAQAPWHEHSVGVYLDCPSIVLIEPVLVHLLPDLDENGSVQSGAELAAILAFKVHIHHGRHHALGDIEARVAVHGVPVAIEKARMLLVQHL